MNNTDLRIREIVGQRSDASSGRLRPIRFVTFATGDLCHDFHSAATARRGTTFQLSISKSYETFTVEALNNPTMPSKDSIYDNAENSTISWSPRIVSTSWFVDRRGRYFMQQAIYWKVASRRSSQVPDTRQPHAAASGNFCQH